MVDFNVDDEVLSFTVADFQNVAKHNTEKIIEPLTVPIFCQHKKGMLTIP